MKKEYDFSKGERGKFFQNNIKLNLPVYLDDEVLQFVESIAKKKNVDLQTVVNRLLKNDIKKAELLQLEGTILPMPPHDRFLNQKFRTFRKIDYNVG